MKKYTLVRILFIIPLIMASMLVSIQLSKANAQGETVCEVYPRSGQVFNLTECDSFQFVSGWFTINKGLLNEFLKGTRVTLTVEGEGYRRIFTPEVVNASWGETFKITPEEAGLDCPVPFLWIRDYFLPLGSLEPGTYNAILTYEFQHPINDGLHVCAVDGSSIPAPSLYRDPFIGEFTFEVTTPYP